MIHLNVTPKGGASFEEFLIEYHNNPVLQKFEIGITERAGAMDKTEIKEELIEKGLTAFLKKDSLLEHVVSVGTSESEIVQIIKKYLDKVSIDNELIIVDPYLFPRRHSTTYSSFITSILEDYLTRIDSIKIITNSGYNNLIKAQVIGDLVAIRPTLLIEHKTSDDFHDRFWISNKRERGILVGSSLNGLGNKYALIDRLNTSDVRVIVKELAGLGLI